MPIPRVVRQWNKAGVNRVTKHIAPWTPGFGVVIHRGRRSGRPYQTPVNVFATEDGYLFALSYGPDTDWVKNVLAAGGCVLRTRGRAVRLTSPRLYHDESRGRHPPAGMAGIAESLPYELRDAREPPICMLLVVG